MLRLHARAEGRAATAEGGVSEPDGCNCGLRHVLRVVEFDESLGHLPWRYTEKVDGLTTVFGAARTLEDAMRGFSRSDEDGEAA